MITRENIINELTERNIVAKPVDVTKNGVVLKGITLGDGPVCPTIYTEQFKDYAEEDLEDVVDVVIYQYNKAKENMPVIDPNQLMNWNYIKDRLQLCLQPKGTEDILKRDFLDLEEYVRVIVETDGESTGSFKVKPEHLNHLCATETELFEAAWKCTEPTIIMQDMAQVVAEMIGMSIDAMEIQKENPIIVASNERKIHEAIAMKAVDKLAEVAERYQSDLAILPSSIHEILLIPVKEGMNFRELDVMVLSVNSNEVAPEEILSNHAYRYWKDTKEITYYYNRKGGKYSFG